MVQSRLMPIYVSTFILFIGQSFVGPFMSLWLRQVIGESSFLRLGLVLSFPMVISLIGILGISNLTDHFGYYRQAIILISLVGMAQYLVLTQINTAFEYLLVASLGALVFPAYYTIALALATNICHPSDKGKTTNYMLLFASAGFFLGSLYAGTGYEELGMEWMLLFAAILTGVSGLIIFAVPKTLKQDTSRVTVTVNPINPPLAHTEMTETGIIFNKKESIFTIVKRPRIILILLCIGILDFCSGGFFIFGTIYINERGKLPYKWIGYGNGVATLLACFLLWRLGKYVDQHGRRFVFILGLLNYPLIFIVLSFFRQPLIVFLIWCLPLYAILRPTASAMIADLTLEHERSRGLSLLVISSNLSMTIGALYIGWAVDHYKIAIDLIIILPALLAWFAVFVAIIFVKETLTISKPEVHI
ncbi:MAG: MFS transporter [Candidatus Hodarchaeota archaeon]